MATFTIRDVVVEVRASLQDEKASSYRYSDATLVRGINHCLKRIALTRPDLFAVITPLTCVLGTVQSAPEDSIRVIDILQTASGSNVNEVNQSTLDLAYSTWQAGTTGTATDWMRHVRNPNQFLVYPPSAAGQELTFEYAQCPPNYTIDQVVAVLGDAYFPVLVDCSVWWFESFDNESVANQRAQMFQQSWQQLIGVTAQAKVATDAPAGGQPPQQVV